MKTSLLSQLLLTDFSRSHSNRWILVGCYFFGFSYFLINWSMREICFCISQISVSKDCLSKCFVFMTLFTKQLTVWINYEVQWFGHSRNKKKQRLNQGLPGHTPGPRQAVCWLTFFHRLPLRINRLGQHSENLQISLGNSPGMNLLHKEHYRFSGHMLLVKRDFTFNLKLEICHGRVN